MRPSDLLREASSSLATRPGRSVLTATGTVLGVASLVATLGLASTAGSRIVTRLNEISATEVVVTATTDPATRDVAVDLPWDAQQRVERLNGVRSAGTLTQVDVGESVVSSVPLGSPGASAGQRLPVFSISSGTLDALRAEVLPGRGINRAHVDRSSAVAVLGSVAADRLNVTRVDNQPAIFIDDRALVVIGIINDLERRQELQSAVLIHDGLARDWFGVRHPLAVHIDTELGAAQQVGLEATIALAPNSPTGLAVAMPSDTALLRTRVGEDIDALFVVLGSVGVLVGSFGIANVTLASVLERKEEIGLRRALGWTRIQIAALFLLESTIVGAIAGALGTSLGIITISVVAASNSWIPVVPVWLPLVAPSIGALAGLGAGLYPASRAAATQPIAALRGAA